MRTLILGIGSSILTDDAVGIVVAGKLGERFAGRADIDIAANEEAGFTLLEEAIGYDRLVVVDSIVSGDEPGTVRRYVLGDFAVTAHAASPHGLNLATVLEFGRRQGLHVPDDVVVYGIAVREVETFGEELTPAVAGCVDDIVETIASEIEGGGNREESD